VQGLEQRDATGAQREVREVRAMRGPGRRRCGGWGGEGTGSTSGWDIPLGRARPSAITPCLGAHWWSAVKAQLLLSTHPNWGEYPSQLSATGGCNGREGTGGHGGVRGARARGERPLCYCHWVPLCRRHRLLLCRHNLGYCITTAAVTVVGAVVNRDKTGASLIDLSRDPCHVKTPLTKSGCR
jgi:hypothetical protein